MRILITGTNRGIGLELTRQYAAAGHEIVATCRDLEAASVLRELARREPGVLPCRLDVTDEGSIKDLAAALESEHRGIDLLINNAAFYGRSSGRLAAVDPVDWTAMFQVNTMGPLLVSRALLPALRRGTDPRVVAISSVKASMTRNTLGASYQYRATKAGLNATMRSLAVDLRSEGIGVYVLSPGWVDQGEDFGAPEDFGDRLRQARVMRREFGEGCARQTLPESVTRLREVIAALGPERSGGFYDHVGEPLEW